MVYWASADIMSKRLTGENTRLGAGCDPKGSVMNSLFTMIAEWEADARATAEELRVGIAKLSEQLAAVETELSRLAVTRETAMSLGYTKPDEDTAADTTAAQPAYLAILAEFERADARCAPDSCARSSTSVPNPSTARACARV